MTLKLIVAHDSKRGIGREGGLPWHIPDDLRRVASLTRDAPEGKRNALIMGRKTWESIPEERRPLKGRDSIVVSGTLENVDGAYVSKSLEEAIRLSKSLGSYDVYIFGGESVYSEALRASLPQQLLVTVVEGDYGCDVLFPDIPPHYALVSTEQKVYEGFVVNHQLWIKVSGF